LKQPLNASTTNCTLGSCGRRIETVEMEISSVCVFDVGTPLKLGIGCCSAVETSTKTSPNKRNKMAKIKTILGLRERPEK
jgi:hypothetical protein